MGVGCQGQGECLSNGLQNKICAATANIRAQTAMRERRGTNARIHFDQLSNDSANHEFIKGGCCDWTRWYTGTYIPRVLQGTGSSNLSSGEVSVRVGFWPHVLRFHGIQPLYKKGVVSILTNYRDVHLIDILAKLMECGIASVIVPYCFA